jgi:single-strand DNA-binding protein
LANFNKVILLGNLTRDPETRATQSGAQVTKFGMAINHKFKGQDGQLRESTCFVDLTAFGRTGEVIQQYCKKGKPLFVEGRLEYSQWQDKEGNKKSKLEVIVENFQFVDAGQRGEGGGAPRAESGGNRFAGPRRPAEGQAPAGGGDAPPAAPEGGGEFQGNYDEIPF